MALCYLEAWNKDNEDVSNTALSYLEARSKNNEYVLNLRASSFSMRCLREKYLILQSVPDLGQMRPCAS